MPGSDAAAVQTLAVPAGGGWRINGSKMWIGAADIADFFIVIAVTDREKRARGGISAFLVDRATPGLTLGQPQFHMGDIPVYELFFDDCWVPEGQLLGDVGQAFVLLANRLGLRRVEIGAHCVGMARRLLELMVRYATTRSTLGNCWAAGRRSSGGSPTPRSRSKRPGSWFTRRPAATTRVSVIFAGKRRWPRCSQPR